MIKLQYERFSTWSHTVESGFLVQLDRVLSRIFDRSENIPFVNREFIDTSTGSKTRLLPDAVGNTSIDWFYQKIDNSVNTITITPISGQLINGAASYTITTAYGFVNLTSYDGNWYIIS